MVAVTWRAHGRPARRVRVPDLAGAAGAVLGAVLAALVAVRGVAGWLLVSYGAWLAWPPAGFIVGGGLLLADRLSDEHGKPERRPE